MTPATAAAVSLLERLRTLAETWTGEDAPGLYSLPTLPGEVERLRFQSPGFSQAVASLRAVNYYDAADREERIGRINDAIKALKETT